MERRNIRSSGRKEFQVKKWRFARAPRQLHLRQQTFATTIRSPPARLCCRRQIAFGFFRKSTGGRVVIAHRGPRDVKTAGWSRTVPPAMRARGVSAVSDGKPIAMGVNGAQSVASRLRLVTHAQPASRKYADVDADRALVCPGVGEPSSSAEFHRTCAIKFVLTRLIAEPALARATRWQLALFADQFGVAQAPGTAESKGGLTREDWRPDASQVIVKPCSTKTRIIRSAPDALPSTANSLKKRRLAPRRAQATENFNVLLATGTMRLRQDRRGVRRTACGKITIAIGTWPSSRSPG